MKKETMKDNFKVFLHSMAHILYLISYVMPRNKDTWVVGNSVGFVNNTKYFFLHSKVNLNKDNCYWISKNKESVKLLRKFGFKAYHPWSLKGLYHLMTAGVYVYDNRSSALNYWTSGNTCRVNLWHGVGIKNIEFKGNLANFKLTWFRRLRNPANYVKPDIFVSTSSLMTEHFKECFRIDDSRCIESDYSRNNVFNMSKDELNDFINTYESDESKQLIERLKKASKVFVYMPTWRSFSPDIIKTAGFDFGRLNEILEKKNELFLLKLHPLTRIDVDLSKYKNIILIDRRSDIYPILPFTDVLVTDYSSIYYDYLLMPDKEILLFTYDYDYYVSKVRDLAFDMNEYMPGVKASTFDDMLNIIDKNISLRCDEQTKIKSLFWDSKKKTDVYSEIALITRRAV